MNPAAWLTLLGALGIPVIVTALFKLIENRITLRSAAPRVDAEAADIGIGSQRKVIETLIAENARLEAKVVHAEQAADEREARHEARVARLSAALDAALDDMHRQLQAARESTEAEIGRLRADAVAFRGRVEALLREHGIEIPPWWPGR